MVSKPEECLPADNVQTINQSSHSQNRAGSNMTTAVKICGISSLDIYRHCAELGVDWVGFVFFSASPRHLPLTQARALADAADSDTQLAVPPRRVALCVDASDDELTAIIDAARPDMLQLHGNETVERVRAIKSKFSLPVMPVIKVAGRADIERAALFSNCADWVLFDAAPHRETITNEPNLPGGMGKSFDWRYLAEAELPLPFMLAGGLTVTNVAQAVNLTNAPCVDVSSGVEKNRGEKSETAISAFVKAAKFG